MLSQTRVHAALPAVDLERARAFYEERLGLSPSQDYPWALVYELKGRTRFSVFLTTNTARAGHTQMGFSVDDIRATVIDLKQRGVHFEEYHTPQLKTIDGIAETDGRKSAWFTDSEGNVIELLQLSPPGEFHDE